MPRRSDLLDRISVTTPCTADWDSMVGNDQVRFCTHCNLNVHDLSSMRRREARLLVRRLGGSLCVRYYRRPDGSLRTLTPTTRFHQIGRRASKMAAGVFGAVLTLNAGAAAQNGPRAGADSQAATELIARKGASLIGAVYDPAGAVIPNASVTALNMDTRQSQAASTDGEGAYRFESLPPGTYSLTATAQGFVAGEVNNVELRQGGEQRQDARLEVQGPQEVVEVTAEVQVVVMGGAMLVSPKDPLVKAALDDDLKAVKELLALGADVNVLDTDADTTALMEAVEHGDSEMVLTLLGAGADVNLRDKTGRTALMSLTDDTPADVARSLLSAGAKVNLKDEDGNTALTQAAGRVKEDALRVLLEAGAKVNARNSNGRTALMMAAQEGMLENVRALLLAGADLNKKDEEGATALKLARDGEHEQVIGLLLAYGAVEE
jgi:hypothetical protein